MTKTTTADTIADPRTTAGELIHTLSLVRDGRKFKVMEIRYVESAGNPYYVIALSTDPDLRAFHRALPTIRMADDAAVAHLNKLLNLAIVPQYGICQCPR